MSFQLGECKRCGRCCRLEIPLTLLDVGRIAETLGRSLEECFDSLIKEDVSKASGLMSLRKHADGHCLLWDEKQGCTIHDAKPRICAFFMCEGKEKLPENMNWTASCETQEDREALCELSVAAEITKVYLQKHGVHFDAADYERAVSSIKDNSPGCCRKLKLSRDPSGAPLALLYDCSTCPERGTQASETPVSLDDLRRIAKHLEISVAQLFERFIDDRPSVFTGGIRLRRKEVCVFHRSGADEPCSIAPARPMHCRFTSCPKCSGGLGDRFFFGSGSIDEQYRHHVAVSETRRYVEKCGLVYRRAGFRRALAEVDRICAERGKAYEDFCRRIAEYRYVDDSLLRLHQLGL